MEELGHGEMLLLLLLLLLALLLMLLLMLLLILLLDNPFALGPELLLKLCSDPVAGILVRLHQRFVHPEQRADVNRRELQCWAQGSDVWLTVTGRVRAVEASRDELEI